MRLLSGATLFAVLCTCTARLNGQQDSRAVLAATLTTVFESLQRTEDARVGDTIAFDPRLLRTRMEPRPHASWPDSSMLAWQGARYDSILGAYETFALLREADARSRRGPAIWVRCGRAPSSYPCTIRHFPAIVAVSAPRISGESAQVLYSVQYRSSMEAHPLARDVFVAYLRRENGSWRVVQLYSPAGT